MGEPAAKVARTDKNGGPKIVGSPRLTAVELPQTAHFLENADVDPEIDNLRISNIRAMVYPQLILEEIPAGEAARKTVRETRPQISRCLHGEDDRLIVIVGPCSIHDPSAAREYALRLKSEIATYKKDLVIIMRVYFEKPRTTVGWKGLINDPDLNDSFNVNKGLRVGRALLEEINSYGVPAATEFLDTITPQYTADLVCWGAIGARTTEFQLHRELASGLSMPIGFKNATSGDCDIAIDAVISSQHPHTFYSTTKHGTVAIVHSKGNDDCHMILRGGKDGPNYSAEHVKQYMAQMAKKNIDAGMVIDASHGNSNKDYRRQPIVIKDICEQLATGNMKIAGVMIESHLLEGAQKLPDSKTLKEGEEVLGKLRYGVSVTDGCIGWTTTAEVLKQLAAAVQARRAARSKK
jgi:3-deoxy-7-phosphoheptulonate synthase